MSDISLSNTCVKATLPSGNHAVYEVQPQHLNLQHFDAKAAPLALQSSDVLRSSRSTSIHPRLKRTDFNSYPNHPKYPYSIYSSLGGVKWRRDLE